MPWPFPTKRQFLRSLGVAWNSRGYQVSGAESVRPSFNSTIRASSVPSTPTASGIFISTLEVVMPCLQKHGAVFLYNPLNAPQLRPVEPTTLFQSHRVQPELGHVLIPFNMNMLRLIRVTGVEEKPVRAGLPNGGHRSPSLTVL